LTSADDGILRNNQANTTLTAFVTDNTGYPVAEQSVAWSLVGATPAGASLSVSASETGENGEATVVLTGDAAATDATATVQAAVGSSTATFDVTLQGVSLSVTAVPTAIIANGVDAAVIEATLRETVAGRGVAEETLIFSTSLGTIGGSDVTDDNGKATVTLIAGTTAGTATVKVYSGPIATGIVDSTTVSLAVPTATSISLSASPTELQVRGTGGTELSTITASVWAGEGLVPVGTPVFFEVSPDGSFANSADTTTVQTNASGQASVTYQSGTASGTKTFTVTSGTASASAQLIIVASGPAAQVIIGNEAGSATDLGNGLTQATVAAIITDAFNNPVSASTEVFFELTGANADTAAITTIVFTDSNGVASATLTYPNDAQGVTVTVRVTVGTVTESRDITLPIP